MPVYHFRRLQPIAQLYACQWAKPWRSCHVAKPQNGYKCVAQPHFGIEKNAKIAGAWLPHPLTVAGKYLERHFRHMAFTRPTLAQDGRTPVRYIPTPYYSGGIVRFDTRALSPSYRRAIALALTQWRHASTACVITPPHAPVLCWSMLLLRARHRGVAPRASCPSPSVSPFLSFWEERRARVPPHFWGKKAGVQALSYSYSRYPIRAPARPASVTSMCCRFLPATHHW